MKLIHDRKAVKGLQELINNVLVKKILQRGHAWSKKLVSIR